ncbi:MAG: hypothetical protein M3209_16105 [Acidobacteriota bacterium]|nr:hypothetical protein [Acidobacteriota bacterium]
MKKTFHTVLFLLLVGALTIFAQNSRAILQAQLEFILERTMLENRILGLTIVVVQNGRVIDVEGFGTVKPDNKQPITNPIHFHPCFNNKALYHIGDYDAR